MISQAATRHWTSFTRDVLNRALEKEEIASAKVDAKDGKFEYEVG